MKIKLLNDGGYEPLKHVKFPVLVEGFGYDNSDRCIGVTGGELLRIGGDIQYIFEGDDLAFLIGEECEIINE